MKRGLFFISLLLLSGWIAGIFLFHGPLQVHSLLVLSAITYMRSLMIGPSPDPSAWEEKI